MADRLAMRDMHQFFIERIEQAVQNCRFIEAVWLEYACLENRYFRIIAKYRKRCDFSGGKCRKGNNQLALSTKMDCVRRLVVSGVPCMAQSFSCELIDETKTWVKKRNGLMHNLLALDRYQENLDGEFCHLAVEGEKIVRETYESATLFRKQFYEKDYEFQFPRECMEQCPCAYAALRKESAPKA